MKLLNRRLNVKRPEGNDHSTLPAGVVLQMHRTHDCPYCGTALLIGPGGGASRNFFCASEECNSRFNIVMVHGLDWGEFTGEVPDWAYESHPWRFDPYDEKPMALPSWSWYRIGALLLFALAIVLYIGRRMVWN